MARNDLENASFKQLARPANCPKANELDRVRLRWLERPAVAATQYRAETSDLLTLCNHCLSQTQWLTRPLRPDNGIACTQNIRYVYGACCQFCRHWAA